MKTSKWVGFDFNHNGWSNTHENHNDGFDQFVRDFRSDLKQMVKGTKWKLHTCKGNWFYIYGFFHNEQDEKWVYFSISDVRFFKDQWYNNVLIRTAKHENDFTGGSNRSTTFSQIAYMLDKI